MRSVLNRVLCGLIATIFCDPILLGVEPQQLLNIVKERHRAARDAIRTLSAEVQLEMVVPQQKMAMSGKYWRSLGSVRIEEYPPGTDTIENHLLVNGEQRNVGRHKLPDGRYDRYGASRDTGSTLLGICDVWDLMAIDFIDAKFARFEYDSLLESAKSTPSATMTKLDGAECALVSFTKSSGDVEYHYEIWHDVARNYLIRKFKKFWSKPTPITVEIELANFQEFPNGIHFPTTRSFRSTIQGKVEQESVATLQKLEINRSISADVFKLPSIPSGTELHDAVEGTRYPIDANWKRIGPAISNPVLPVEQRITSSEKVYFAQSTEEPRSYSFWLIAFSVLFLFAAVFVWFLKRKRKV